MKFIFVLLTVCTVAQSHYSDFDVNPVDPATQYDGSSIRTDFEYELAQQFTARKIAIYKSWTACKKVFTDVPDKDTSDIFQNPLSGNERDVTDKAKCLVDCIMNKTGVMSEKGFDVDKYMEHIKQLRYNYTTFDINSKSIDEKDKLLDTISRRAIMLPSYRPNVQSYAILCKRKSPHPNLCNDLIESYALAARECKKLENRSKNTCEASFTLMRCIMEENRSRSFNGPFYPVSFAMRRTMFD